MYVAVNVTVCRAPATFPAFSVKAMVPWYVPVLSAEKPTPTLHVAPGVKFPTQVFDPVEK
jgi:hypothetical protein